MSFLVHPLFLVTFFPLLGLLVMAFLKEEQWTTTVAYSQGLERLLGVQTLPTLVIFDRNGRVVFRKEGVDFDTFVETLDKKLRETLSALPQAASR